MQQHHPKQQLSMCHTSHLTLLQDGLCHEVSSDDRDCHGLRGVLYNGTNQVRRDV